jgi:hypothetical protein
MLAVAFIFSACPKHIAGTTPPPVTRPPKIQAPNVLPPTPVAHVIFIPSPVDPLYPERETYNAEFAKAALEVFTANNWSYKEVKLSEHIFSEWEDIMLEAITDTPTIVFTYDTCYVPLLMKMARQPEKRIATYIVTLAPVPDDVSPLLMVLEPRMEELGFLAGAALARMSTTTHLATVTFDNYEGGRFVAGFYQGVSEERGSVSHTAIYVERGDLIGAQESAQYISGKLAGAAKRFKAGMGIDGVALLLGPLVKPFIQSLPPAGFHAACGPVPMDDPMHGVVTSVYMDFGKIPQYLVDNAEDLNLLAPKVPTIARSEGGVGITSRTRGAASEAHTQYISVGLADGILNWTGMSQFAGKHSLPEGLEKDIQRYAAAIISGEMKVSAEKPQ